MVVEVATYLSIKDDSVRICVNLLLVDYPAVWDYIFTIQTLCNLVDVVVIAQPCAVHWAELREVIPCVPFLLVENFMD